MAPDGCSRKAIAINGSIPGPTIEANWGDEVVVHLTNGLSNDLQNGTSIHFHGIRQFWANQDDGAVSITQCPTTPSNSITYRWRAMQYGTACYHSHIGLQAWEGLFGGIVIHGPASANYDEGKGVIILNDWDINTVDELFLSAPTEGLPTLENALMVPMSSVKMEQQTKLALALILLSLRGHLTGFVSSMLRAILTSNFHRQPHHDRYFERPCPNQALQDKNLESCNG